MAIKCISPFPAPYLSLTPPSPRFNIYILDYCKKRGYRKTASELVIEADISPDSKPPINAQQGLLFEFVPLCSLSLNPSDPLSRWWSVFWVLFQAKNNGAGSEDAMLYHKVPHIRHFHLATSP
jgi:collagen type III alpha